MTQPVRPRSIRPALTLALALAAGACGRAETKAPSGATAGSTASSPASAVTKPTPGAPAVTDAPATGPAATVIPGDAKQLVTAVVDGWDETRATLRRFRRGAAGWEPEGEPWPGVIGKSGAAWGAGLHGTAAPANRTGPVKREGDGRSPAGAFAMRGSYGYAKAPPPGTRLPYVPLDERWKCVDDPASKHYDRILDRTTVAPDWKSAEEMRRADELYAWVVDVAHNPAHAPGAGSCIFLHVWRGEGSSTAGCTAMDEQKLAALLATLDPSAVFVLLPRADYESLAPAWGLPVLTAPGARSTKGS